jgi:hypothetical protein
MRVGDNVVCINSDHENEYKGIVFEEWVKKDHIYTVRELLDNDGITPSVLLEELYNQIVYIPVLGKYQEPSFRLDRFRALTEMEQEEVNEFYGIKEEPLEILTYVN